MFQITTIQWETDEGKLINHHFNRFNEMYFDNLHLSMLYRGPYSGYTDCSSFVANSLSFLQFIKVSVH